MHVAYAIFYLNLALLAMGYTHAALVNRQTRDFSQSKSTSTFFENLPKIVGYERGEILLRIAPRMRYAIFREIFLKTDLKHAYLPFAAHLRMLLNGQSNGGTEATA